jgi:hypothetical protein
VDPTVVKPKPVDVVVPEDDVAPEMGSDGPSEERGSTTAYVEKVRAGGVDPTLLAEELTEREEAMTDCFVAGGVEFADLDLRVTWSREQIASVEVRSADPDDPSAELQGCLATAIGNAHLPPSDLRGRVKFPATVDVGVEYSLGQYGGVVGGVVGD